MLSPRLIESNSLSQRLIMEGGSVGYRRTLQNYSSSLLFFVPVSGNSRGLATIHSIPGNEVSLSLSLSSTLFHPFLPKSCRSHSFTG